VELLSKPLLFLGCSFSPGRVLSSTVALFVTYLKSELLDYVINFSLSSSARTQIERRFEIPPIS
jgi:hypothetical protein